MATEAKKSLLVYSHWNESAVLMGTLHSVQVRGKEVFSFEYDAGWLKSGNAQQLDPELGLYTGHQFLRDEKNNFGIFLDSSPDRWGRILMKRREAILATKEKRKEKTLFETDFLLGVYDSHRMGALRFKETADGNFLNENNMATPPWASIADLEHASLELEKEHNDPETLKWINMLLASGSSLGGVRPKASVIDKQGNLWIAKFPSKDDKRDIGVWEMVVYEMAVMSGLRLPESKAQKFFSKQHTFLSKRFDRNKEKRIHFASAMTLLGYTDGTNYQSGATYLELVEFISRQGSNPAEDLEELWKRIVFSICVSNTDDHLRNHGFLLNEKGWSLSPAFDINPNESGTGLSLNISENSNALDLDVAMSVIGYFRITERKGKEIIAATKEIVADWNTIAESYHISRPQQELMKSAFRY